MQKAFDSYIAAVKEIIQEDELEQAIEYMEQLDDKLDIGIENDLVMQKGRLKAVEKDMQRGLIPYDRYGMVKAQIRFALLSIGLTGHPEH